MEMGNGSIKWGMENGKWIDLNVKWGMQMDRLKWKMGNLNGLNEWKMGNGNWIN